MGDTTVSNLTTTTLNSSLQDYSVDPRQSEGLNSGNGDTYYNNPQFTTWFGYYKTIPELKAAIDALALYTIGKGFMANARNAVILDNIYGWGEDTFLSILYNMLLIKKINGDAYAEVIRDDRDVLINLKVLDPATMTTVIGNDGLIKHYEQRSKTDKTSQPRILPPAKVLHLVNNRVADEVHGTSIVEACKWVIDARNEAMSDWRRISHRSTIRVLYIDVDNTTKLTTIKNQYADAIKNGELLILPAKKGDAEFGELTLPPIDNFLGWIRYLENFFYQAVGVPKIILGGSEEFTEASSKIALLTFDQVWKREQRELAADLWNQLAIKIEFDEPVSLKGELITDEGKNTGQTNIQPNDTMINSGADNLNG